MESDRAEETVKDPGFELPDVELPTDWDINASIRRGVAFLLNCCALPGEPPLLVVAHDGWLPPFSAAIGC